MKFTGKEDIEKPIEEVFAAVTDHDAFEKQLLRRGHEVTRTDSLAAPGAGMGWKFSLPWRGHEREITVSVTRYEPPELLMLDLRVGGLEAELRIDLIALSKTRTRMSLEMELKPRTITARVLVQSLRLRRASLMAKLHRRMAEFAERIEERPGPGA